MPEGPEVRIISESLNRILENQYLLNFTITEKSRYFRDCSWKDELMQLLPIKIEKIYCKGKLIIFKLDKIYLLFTLALEGRFIFEEENNTGLILEFGKIFSDTDYLYTIKEQTVYYDDSRHFGTVRLVQEDEFKLIINKLGYDLLDIKLNDLDYDKLILSSLRKKNKQNIIDVLLNQEVISGVGNYLRSDGLYLAKINPFTKIEDIDDFKIIELIHILQEIMLESYHLGGHSLHTYHSPDGELGKYVPKVYQRKTDDLGKKVIRGKAKDGRSIFYVELDD